MPRLKLFGRATIEGPHGPLSGRVAQRRQIALLAFLSLQGERPTSRDKLQAILWPESDARRARHALADAIYLIRKALGEGSIVSVGDGVLLSPERVPSDVAEFGALLEADRLHEAVEMYAGPLLDGFHLPDSPDFEHWLGLERERLLRAQLGALERLAEAAETDGKFKAAVEWWRRAAALEAHNSRVAVRLMRALAESGDRAGALRWASVHEELLEDRFGLAVDPVVTELAEELRSSGAEGERGGPAPSPAVLHSSSGPGSRLRPVGPAAVRSGRSRRRPGLLVGFAAGVGLMVLAAALYRGLEVPFVAADLDDLDPSLVVIAPFRTAGASAELEYLGEGMVELLAAKLSGAGDLRAVDPGASLSGWRSDDPVENGTSVVSNANLARAHGARNVMSGAVVGTGAGLTIHGSIVDAVTERTTAEATVQGSEEMLHDLVDRFVLQLLARRAGEEEDRLAHLTSTSLPALRTFLRARAAHREGDYEEALREYGRALDIDSTFALAGRGIVQVSGWVGGSGPLQERGTAVALRYADRLSERDRVGLMGRIAPPSPGRLPSAVERLEAVEEALRRWPDHPNLWYRRGDELLHFGAALELPSWERRARESFERAAQLDPDYAEPIHHLAVILGESGDTAALRSLVQDQLARNAKGPVADHLRWRAYHNLGASTSFGPPSLEEMDTDATLRWIGIEAQDYGFAVPEGARAVELRLERPGIRDEHFERRQGAFAYALNGGRPSAALEVLETIEEVQADPHFHLRIRVLTGLYADGDIGEAERAARELTLAPTRGAIGGLNRCVLVQWRLARWADGGPAVSEQDLPPEVPAGSTGDRASSRAICSAVVRAQHATLALGTASHPATEALELLLAHGRHWTLVDDGHTEYAHVALARIHEAAGRPDAALRAIRRRGRYMGWQPYLATMLREEGRLASMVGDQEGAMRAFEHYLALRTDPEPVLQPELEQVRDRLEGLRRSAGW